MLTECEETAAMLCQKHLRTLINLIPFQNAATSVQKWLVRENEMLMVIPATQTREVSILDDNINMYN